MDATAERKRELRSSFPKLRDDNFDLKSPIDPSYNCAAFAGGVEDQWWDPYNPGGTWPDGIEREVSLRHFVSVFESYGFDVCDATDRSPGFDRIVLYGDAGGDFCHAARQLTSGEWASKLGELEDIVHATPEDVSGSIYGQPKVFMRRSLDRP